MKKSILFLIPTLENGGAEKVLVNLANNMDHSKFDVTVHTIFNIGVHRERLNKRVHYTFFLKKPFRGYTVIIKMLPAVFLYKLIIKKKYDVVISYLEGSSAKIVSGCPFEETKKIAWIHTVMDTPGRFCIGFFNKRQAQIVYRKFKRLVFVSQSAKDEFDKVSGLNNISESVVYNTNETLSIKSLSKEPIEDIVFQNDALNICSVGKITPNKGFDRLAHIVKKLNDDGINVHVYAIGVGKQQEEIQQYLIDNDLEEAYTFLGYKENPYKYVAACDLYVCASHREGFSTAVTEALIVGTPVVSTDCSGAYELLGENQEYGIVTENNENSLYKGIKRLALDKALYNHYKECTRKRSLDFSTEKTVKEVEDLIEEVLHE